MTILFSDIRGFTKLSEKMSPRENFSFINSYLEHMEPVITRHNGIIDKYIGDAIMAFFPTNADDAVEAAIEMLYELAIFNEDRSRAGLVPVKIGIGLNTGFMMLGTVGGKGRMESTVISDAVNLASRIETMTKDYEISLLITEHTYYSLQDTSKYRMRFADRVKVKGKEQPQSVYEIFDADPAPERYAKTETIRIFERAIAYYYFKEGKKACKLFKECLDICPEDSLAKLFCGRCERFEATGIHEGTGEIDLAVEWTPDIAIGHPEIDEQHRLLFETVKKFVDTVKKDRDFSHAEPIIKFLDDYVRIHFQREHDIMEENNYPFLDMQTEQHESFSMHFAKLKQEISEQTDLYFLLFKIQVLLIDWLIHHTSRLDGHFGKFLRWKAPAR
jgi:hemerythrin-like metal-binding protein